MSYSPKLLLSIGLLSLSTAVFLPSAYAFAAEEKKAENSTKAASPQKKEKEKDKGAELITIWQDKTNDMLDGMSDNQRKQFEYIIATNGIIHSIEEVQGTLHNGVKSCAKANPDMADEMNKASKAFDAKLVTPMEGAEARLEKMIRHQSIASRNDMRNYITLTNRAAVAKKDEVDFIPVSRKDDCEKLLKTLKSDKSDKLAQYLNESFGLDKNLRPVTKGEKK
ncbi:MAG: hypothetical protein AB7E85_03055 [Pseudobdellovibrionaceae bacterium]